MFFNKAKRLIPNYSILIKFRFSILIAVYLITCLYFTYCSMLHFKRFYNFDPNCCDVIGTIACLQGWKESIVKSSVKIINYLIYDVKTPFFYQNKEFTFYVFCYPALYLYLIYLIFFPFPEASLVLQVFIISIGALLIFFLANQILKNTLLSFTVFISYILQPAVSTGCISGFSPFIILIPILFSAFYYLEKNNFNIYIFFIILANLVRLDAVIITMLFGLCLVITGKNRRYGKVTILISIVFLLINMVMIFYISTSLNKPFPTAISNLQFYGGSYQEALKTILTKPKIFIENFLQNNKLMVLIIFIPIGIISIFSPLFLIPIVFHLMYCLLIRPETTLCIALVPFVFLSYIYGVKRIVGKINILNRHFIFKWLNKNNSIIAFSIFILILSIIPHFFLTQYSPFTSIFSFRNFEITEHSRIGHKFLEMIPIKASLLAENHHLRRFSDVGIFPYEINAKPWEYIILDLTEKRVAELPLFNIKESLKNNDFIKSDEYKITLISLLRGNTYGVLTYKDKWLLLKRGHSTKENPKILQLVLNNFKMDISK